MINFDDLQAAMAMAANTTNNGVVAKELTTEQVMNALISESLERSATDDIDHTDPKSPEGRAGAKTLALKYEEEGSGKPFLEFMEFKVQEYSQKFSAAAQSGNASLIQERLGAASLVCAGLNNLLNKICKNAYYKKLQAERMEEPVADRGRSNNNAYDGFASAKFAPHQVTDAIYELMGSMDDKLAKGTATTLHGLYNTFNGLSAGQAFKPRLVTGAKMELQQDKQGNNVEVWIDLYTPEEIWEQRERQRLDRIQSRPQRSSLVAAM